LFSLGGGERRQQDVLVLARDLANLVEHGFAVRRQKQ
jgi:hypothetical protein